MSEEQPSFRLVTDNSAFVRKPGVPPAEVPPDPAPVVAETQEGLDIRLAKPESKEGEKKVTEIAPGTIRECGGCSKNWGENLMIFRARRDDGKGDKLWVCPVCQQNGAYKLTGEEKVRVRGQSMDTTKLFIGFATLLIVVSTLVFWKFHSDSVNEKVDWITEEWIEKPAVDWPALSGTWEARVEGMTEPLRAPAILLEKRDGSVVAIAFTSPAWLAANKVKERKIKDFAPKIKTSVFKVPGKPDLILGEFANLAGSTQETVWTMRCTQPRKQLPSEPLKVRRQTYAVGMLGTLVRHAGDRQTSVGCRIIQGVRDSDEYVVLTDAPITPEGVNGAVLIDQFGHVVAIGAELIEGTTSRVAQRVAVRWALPLKGAEK